jgi:ABC-type glycerol-3-phosphate transport system permease component
LEEEYIFPPNEILAISVLATIPVVTVFWLLQKFLRTGFALTGIKG